MVFPSLRIFQFVVIHTVKGFGIVNKAKVEADWDTLTQAREEYSGHNWYVAQCLKAETDSPLQQMGGMHIVL